MTINVPHRRIVILDSTQLPIACPNEHTPPNLMHPRVYLDPTQEDMAMCPYCGTVYRIRGMPVEGSRD